MGANPTVATNKPNKFLAMIIDLILDRKDGEKYRPREFYYSVLEYRELWPDLSDPITRAMDGGTESDVKNALCDYIIKCGYNTAICEYINAVNWL